MNLAPGIVETILMFASLLLLLSIIASKVSGKIGVPMLLLFLVIGMLAGSEGPGGIYFDDAGIAQAVGVVALVLILFAGGLDTKWKSVKPVLRQGIALSTAGVLLTTLLLGWFIHVLTELTWVESMLLGSIVSSTDAAAVFAVLRSRNVRLKHDLQSLLELESGSNDPMAVFLTLGFIRLLLEPETSLLAFIPMFIQQMIVGAVIGYGAGLVIIRIINRLRLEYEGLYPVLTLSLIFLTYSLITLIGGNGFLAAYIAGIVIGNGEFIHKRSILRFHDGLAWLMQIIMFITLGLLVFPSQLIPVFGVGMLIAIILMLAARPLGVYITLMFSRFNFREKTMIAWVGLRGAVPIILATFPLLAGVDEADIIFDIVFFVVITSALIQGTSIPYVARWLRVEEPEAVSKPTLLKAEDIRSCLTEVSIPQGSPFVDKQIVEAGFPERAIILLVNRGGEIFTPTGGTVIQSGDILLLTGDDESIEETKSIVSQD